MDKKCKKIIAIMLVLVIIISNLSTIGLNIGEVIAADTTLEKQNSKTNNANVEFDTYFLSGETKTYEATKNIGEENRIMVKLTVKDAGYLKNAVVQFNDANFEILNSIESDSISEVTSNEIAFKQINADENVEIEVPIEFMQEESINPSKINFVNTVKMTGTYVDDNGKQHQVEKEILLGLNWTASNVETVLESEITKFVPYDINGEKGLILQTTIKSGIKDNALPIKNTNIEIETPTINNILPTAIKVSANSTIATNGEDGISFEQSNYSIEENKVTINVENVPDENGNIKWIKQGLDEYVISYIYSEEVLNAVNEGEIQIALNSNSIIKVYNDEETSITANFQEEKTVNEIIGNIVDFYAETVENLSKGQMYANLDAEKKLEIEYNEKITANIALAELTDEIIINQNEDTFDSTTKVSAYNKNISVSKEMFDKILGEEGYINIYVGQTLIGTIDNNIKANGDNNLVLDLSELNINSMTIKTSKPLTEGKLELNINKAIKGDTSYSKAQIQNFNQIILNINGKAINSETTLVEQNVETQINLVEPTMQAELAINNNNLSTLITNENIEIRAILKTTSEYNKLFKNPKIEIELPSYIEKMDITNIQLLYDDELTIDKQNYIEETDGTKKIEITLKGVQTKYSTDLVSGGANILIVANITANNLTPNTTSQIKMTVTNENEVAVAELPINFIAPVGIVTANKITNNTDATQIMALTSDETAQLDINATKKEATAEIQIINNYSNIINNIRILGRTLMQGTTDTETFEDLNNTFDAPMTSSINTNGFENATIYYSENGNATEDLADSQNGWTTEVEDFSKIKSYLIVLNDYTMNIGDSVKFTYNVQIPENLNYSETVNSVYTVYFDNVQEQQTLRDRAKARTVTLTTGTAPSLEVKLESTSQENSVVREGQYIKFKATVTNTGSVDAENTKLKIVAPNGNIYTYYDSQEKAVKFTEDTSLITDTSKQLVAKYSTVHTEYLSDNFTNGYVDNEDPEKTIEIGTIEAGKSVEVEYELKLVNVEIYNNNAISVGKLEHSDETGGHTVVEGSSKLVYLDEVILNNTATAIADEMTEEVESNIYKLKFEKSYANLVLSTDKEEDYTLIKGDTLKYTTSIESSNKQELTNVIIKVYVPDGLEIKDATLENADLLSENEIEYSASIDNTNNIVIFSIPKLPTASILECNVETVVGDTIGSKEAYTTLEADDVPLHYSNTRTNNISKLEFEIKQLAADKQYVKEQEQVTYTYVITNKSNVYTSSFNFENSIPEGMKFKGAVLTSNGSTTDLASTSDEETYILKLPSFKADTSITLKVIMEAELLPDGVTEKEVTNYASIYGDDFEKLTSNSVKTTIEYNEDSHKIIYEDGTIGTDITKTKYKISGLAWIDANKDGQRDDDEELLSGVEVRLLNKNTNEIVKDVTTGNEKKTTTSSTGEYTFTNLENGEYLVVFLYNYSKYDLTSYKVANVNDTVNSDVIDITMNIDGKDRKVAISDTIKIVGSNARNIDIGLCESNKSDLKLDKYISSITLTYGSTVKTYDYNDIKLAKVEIPAKELSNATVIVNYKIVVTNEGAIANYVKKVVDYIPADMKFNSELNRDWYQSTNGDLYNSSLSNLKLESGESAELTLTLTRKMTSSNTGIVNNNAEIYEVYNEEGIQDIDSTPANKVTTEDDLSSADVVISIKTGDAVIYTIIISTLICGIIVISAYYIRKKVLKKM